MREHRPGADINPGNAFPGLEHDCDASGITGLVISQLTQEPGGTTGMIRGCAPEVVSADLAVAGRCRRNSRPWDATRIGRGTNHDLGSARHQPIPESPRQAGPSGAAGSRRSSLSSRERLGDFVPANRLLTEVLLVRRGLMRRNGENDNGWVPMLISLKHFTRISHLPQVSATSSVLPQE